MRSPSHTTQIELGSRQHGNTYWSPVHEILGMTGEEIADVLASADAAQRVLELGKRPSLGERLGHQGHNGPSTPVKSDQSPLPKS